jgi:hypothetical protein
MCGLLTPALTPAPRNGLTSSPIFLDLNRKRSYTYSMTTITLKIKDDSKANDVLRFLRDIDFLEIEESSSSKTKSKESLHSFPGIDLGWSKGSMTREEMNAR